MLWQKLDYIGSAGINQNNDSRNCSLADLGCHFYKIILKDLDELTIDEEILCQGVEREFIKNVIQKS